MALKDEIYIELAKIAQTHREEEEFTTLPPEFIVYYKLNDIPVEYSDGRAMQRYYYYRVSFYSIDKSRVDVAIGQIDAAMQGLGFFLRESGIPIPREAPQEKRKASDGLAYWGAYSEFAIWRASR